MWRRTAVIAVAATFLFAGFATAYLLASDSATAQIGTTGETTTGTETTGAPQAQSLDNVFWKIFFLSVLVAAVWSIPYLLDIVLAYRSHENRLKRLIPEFRQLIIEASKGQELTMEELRELIRAVDVTYQSPKGVTGLARTLFSFAVLATISTVLFALIALGRTQDEDIVQTIVAALLGAFTTIVGVYFGSRTAESATEIAAENARQAGLAPDRGGEGMPPSGPAATSRQPADAQGSGGVLPGRPPATSRQPADAGGTPENPE